MLSNHFPAMRDPGCCLLSRHAEYDAIRLARPASSTVGGAALVLAHWSQRSLPGPVAVGGPALQAAWLPWAVSAPWGSCPSSACRGPHLVALWLPAQQKRRQRPDDPSAVRRPSYLRSNGHDFLVSTSIGRNSALQTIQRSALTSSSSCTRPAWRWTCLLASGAA